MKKRTAEILRAIAFVSFLLALLLLIAVVVRADSGSVDDWPAEVTSVVRVWPGWSVGVRSADGLYWGQAWTWRRYAPGETVRISGKVEPFTGGAWVSRLKISRGW